MALRPRRRVRPRLESLETRIAMSLPAGADTFGLTPPANTIGLGRGDVSRPGSRSATTVTIDPGNVTPGKATTEFGVFVQPYGDSGIVPKVVAIKQNGKELPTQHGRVYNPRLAGMPSNKTVVFFETGKPGTVTITISGRGLSTGAYTVETTLSGDLNGDGSVTTADALLFPSTFAAKPSDVGPAGGSSTTGGAGSTGPATTGGGVAASERVYNPAADSNQNGVVNLYDALALERNMPAPNGSHTAWAAVNLAPADQITFAGSKNSGGTTFAKNITINGYTTPGSVVLVDADIGFYTFASQALAAGPNGFFSVGATNTQGVNTYNFKILDPHGHQTVRSFPVFWIPYAVPNSKYHYKPSRKSSKPGGGFI